MGQVRFDAAWQRIADSDRMVASQHRTARTDTMAFQSTISLCVRDAANVEREMVFDEGPRDPATQDVARSGRRNRRSINIALPQKPRSFKTALAGQRRSEEGTKRWKGTRD